MADTKISALSAASALDGTEPFPVVQGGSTVKATGSQMKTYVKTGLTQADVANLTTADSPQFTAVNIGHATDSTLARVSAGVISVEGSTIHSANMLVPARVTANFYVLGEPMSVTSGNTIVVDTIYYNPFRVFRDITLTDLGARVSTAVASQNFGVAIYAHDGATNRPTGTPLAATGNMATDTATVVTADITGANVTLTPGLYWAAIWASTSSAGFVGSTSDAVTAMARFIGSATATNLMTTNSIEYITSAETFNTAAWPNAASETFTEAAGGAGVRAFALIGKAA